MEEQKEESILKRLINSKISEFTSLSESEDEILKASALKLAESWNALKNFSDGTIKSISQEVVDSTITECISVSEKQHLEIVYDYCFTNITSMKEKLNKMLAESNNVLKELKSANAELKELLSK